MTNTNDSQHYDSPQYEPVIRPATQAGRFYDGNPDRLRREVDSLLSLHAQDAVLDHVAALIVPHAGYYYSGNVAATAYTTLNPQKPYKRIFLLGPSHHTWVNGASVNDEADYYSTPLGKVRVDKETVQALLDADTVFSFVPEAHDNEH
ncbi:MAG: AmmeMemoRadiSam system protein B, partial [Prevotella sp.]|nr:AmmeMemoRadiSam system protein B [Prevotella sp.]